jgi:hypothetical protein
MSSVIFAMNFPFLCGLIVVRTPGISRVLTTFAPHQGSDTPPSIQVMRGTSFNRLNEDVDVLTTNKPHSGDVGHILHPDQGQALDSDRLDITISSGIFSLSLTSLHCHRRKFIDWTGALSSVRFVGQNFQDPFLFPRVRPLPGKEAGEK